MHYNLDYALRICTQNNRIQSCVLIFSSMGLYGEAVDLALKVPFFATPISCIVTCFKFDINKERTWVVGIA